MGKQGQAELGMWLHPQAPLATHSNWNHSWQVCIYMCDILGPLNIPVSWQWLLRWLLICHFFVATWCSWLPMKTSLRSKDKFVFESVFFCPRTGKQVCLVSILFWVVMLCGLIGRYQCFGETFQPWKRNVSPKCCYPPTSVHAVTSQKANSDILTAMRISTHIFVLCPCQSSGLWCCFDF
jgi:hypothetical protein